MERILELSYLKQTRKCLCNDIFKICLGFILLFECLTGVIMVLLEILKFLRINMISQTATNLYPL